MAPLVLKNAHVLDPGRGVDARLDINITDGLIAEAEPRSDGPGARELDVGQPGRYVVPGLIDIHAHVAHGGTTPGVGMGCCVPDEIGVRSGVTTLLDAGSVGVASVGVFPEHILPRARTRVICFVNIGTFAHAIMGRPDVTSLSEIDAEAVAACAAATPGLVSGLKLRLVGPLIVEAGECIVDAATRLARTLSVPLMVHIGDWRSPPASEARLLQVTEYVLDRLERGDIITHVCTPGRGGLAARAAGVDRALVRARERGVVLDAALGASNFSHRVAADQFARDLRPDTISSDLTRDIQSFHSLLECMAKFMAIGYSLRDVVRMTTANAAAAIGHADSAGSLAPGRVADITILDAVEGDFVFSDAGHETFHGQWGLVPIQTMRAGELHRPGRGTHPWGWLPESQSG